MTPAVFLVLLVTLMEIANGRVTDDDWHRYKLTYEKNYDSEEDMMRRINFVRENRLIEKCNKEYRANPKTGYECKPNVFSDWTELEKQQFLMDDSTEDVPQSKKMSGKRA